MVDPRGRTPARGEATRVGSAESLTQLARAALTGSTADHDAFLGACWQYAYAAAMRLRRKHQGAEDSAQDAAKAVWDLLKRNPPALKPETVGGLVGVVVLRRAHAAARLRLREASAGDQAATACEAPDTALEAETAEWTRRVRDAVVSLQQPLRRLVELEYWGDLSTREIARETGMSQSSIIRRLAEAEAALKSRLRGLDDADHDRRDSPPRRSDRA
jgi:RNA polymerase sigma factor (sigma-70 family)